MKKANKRKITTLIVSAAVLILLCVVLIVVRNRASAYEEAESAKSNQTVFDITADQMTEITYTVSGGTELDFKKNDDKKWTDASDGTVLDQTKVGTLASSFTGVKLTETISDVEDLSEYGLDQPSYTCSFTDKDGKTTKFYLGNTNDSANVIYLYIDGDTSTVYAVSTGITSEMANYSSMDDYLPDSSASANSVSEASSTQEASSESEAS